MAEFVPRVCVVRADILGQHGIAENITILLGESRLPEHPIDKIIAWPIGQTSEDLEIATVLMLNAPLCLGMDCGELLTTPVIWPIIAGVAAGIALGLEVADCIINSDACKDNAQRMYVRCVDSCSAACTFEGHSGQGVLSWGCYFDCAGCCWATARQDKKNCGLCGNTQPSQSSYDYCIDHAFYPPPNYPKKPRPFDGMPSEWPNP